MLKDFDLIVIGTGMGGSIAAYKCRKAGLSVAIIDRNPFGGTCALRGCDPKKVLVGAANLVDYSKRLNDKGILPGIRINWQELMEFKRSFTNPVPENQEKSFKKAGIETFHGVAKFIDERSLRVNDDKLAAKNILIANGAKPAKLGITGEEYFTYSDQFLELSELPRKIIFVGGGFISFEFAHVAALAGSEVKIIHRSDHPLDKFDNDLVQLLIQKTRKLGIGLELNAEVNSIEKLEVGYRVTAAKNNEMKSFDCDIVVHGAGREPELNDMDLENGKVKREKKGISVNEYLQSISNPFVYSVGDAAATGGLPLTPVASMESHIAASNILKGNHKIPEYGATPSVVFTIPHLASVGLKEKEANEKGLKFRVRFEETSGWYSAKRINEEYSAHKILIEKESEKILGAHLLGHHSDELINLFAMAIKFGITAANLKKMIYSYPTRASDISYMV